MNMRKHAHKLDARSRLEQAISDMYKKTHEAEQCNEKLFRSLQAAPAPEPGARQHIALHLSLERSDTSRLSVMVRGTTHSNAGHEHACWHFEHGPLALQANDNVQILQLPRISDALQTPVDVSFSSDGAHSVTLCRVQHDLSASECQTLEGGLHSLNGDYGVMINMDEFTLLFPVAEETQDAAVESIFTSTHDPSVEREQRALAEQLNNLATHAQHMLRMNYAGALRGASRSAPGVLCTCKALDAKLRRFSKLFACLDTTQKALLPSARMLDVLALFQLPGMVLRPRVCSCRSGLALSAQGVEDTGRKMFQLCDTARKLGSVWQELCKTSLPAHTDGLQHLIEQHKPETQHELSEQMKRLHNLRQAQCKLINSVRAPLRTMAAPAPALPGLAWNGGGYPAIVDVRAHYIGLGAIDAACLRLGCLLSKSLSSTMLLPATVHEWQLHQLWANNEHNSIALSETAFQHNLALARDMAAVAPLPHASDLRSSAPAALAAVAMLGVEPGRQLASSVCASAVQSNDVAASVPAAPALESLDPGGGRQHLALCQLHALVNTDLLNRLITPPLHRYMVSAMQAAAACLRSDAALDPAELAQSRQMRERAALEVVQVFGAEVQPLARLALLGQPPPRGVNVLAFLESDTAAAYDREQCLRRVAGIIFDTAARGKREPAEQHWQRVVSKTRQTSRRSVHWREPL